VYRSAYPSDVTGIVLVDAGEDNPERIGPDGKTVRADTLVKGTPIPPIKTSGPLRIADIPPGALAAMRQGIAQTLPHANDPPRDRLPEDAKRMRAWALAQIGHVAAAVNPVEIEELALIRAERTAKPYAYGDLPLVVITRGKAEESPEFEETRRAAHKAVADASRKGRHLIAQGSGHHVQIEDPELVVKAIQEVVRAPRY
jgi:pimeloyl-ACP methyl ester carboxylesterase